MEEPFKNYGTSEQPLYIATYVGKIFKYDRQRISKIVNTFQSDEVIRNYKLPNNTVNNFPYRNMFTLKGLKRFLCQTRKHVPEKILNYYGIAEYNKINMDEGMWLAHIKKAFQGEEIIEQFRLDTYRLDAYFPAHNVIIEVDEYGHSAYNVADEAARSARVNQVLKNPT